METRPVVITPQRLRIEVTPAQVHDLIVAQRGPLTAAAKPFGVRDTADLEIVAEVEQALATAELVWRSATRFLFRLHSPNLAHVWQELTLLPVPEGTELTLAAGFTAHRGSDYRRIRLHWEQAVRRQLLMLAGVALREPSSTENFRDLLVTVEEQEEAEWGHAGHSHGVERVAVGLAQAIVLPPRQVEQLQQAARLHDIGKVALDSALWTQRGILLASQRAAMETHAPMGSLLAARVGVPDPVLVAIRHHHERWDGHGYPLGLAGEEIPLRARILFLAETVDSMLRPSYRRPALSPRQVVTRLEAGAGHEWDPRLVRLAVRLLDGRTQPLRPHPVPNRRDLGHRTAELGTPVAMQRVAG